MSSTSVTRVRRRIESFTTSPFKTLPFWGVARKLPSNEVVAGDSDHAESWPVIAITRSAVMAITRAGHPARIRRWTGRIVGALAALALGAAPARALDPAR